MKILYLLNHKTLTDFEVPILLKGGHEVYMSKNFNSLKPGENSINHSTSRYYDNFLSTHVTTLKTIDNIDFYSSYYELSQMEMDIINSHFDCIFLTSLISEKLLNQLSHSFHGEIYFRFFGLSGETSYKDLLSSSFPGTDFSRFKYLFSYQEIIDFELSRKDNFDFFNKENSIFLPLGLSNSFVCNYLETYKPSKSQICFVNSRIDDGPNSYYRNIYLDFLNKFEGLPFIILGKNNSCVEGKPYILNNLNDDEYYKEFQHSLFMYYHSKEERHLHYHPLEASIIGVPVLFYSQSLLKSFLPNSPGICYSENEMLEKCRLILSRSNKANDLINSIITYQNQNIDKLFIGKNLNIFDHFIK